jgi:hypothetical protein
MLRGHPDHLETVCLYLKTLARRSNAAPSIDVKLAILMIGASTRAAS